MKIRWPRLGQRKDELREELEAHLRMAIADRVEHGASEEDARRQARQELGNAALIQDVTREMWGGITLERTLQDVRYAFRQVGRSPGFACAVVLTLGLGLGAAVSMYTVVDRVLLRPLPYRDAGSLVKVTELSRDGEPGWGIPFLDIVEWQARSQKLESIAYYSVNDGSGHIGFLEGKDRSIGVSDASVSANLFSTLGVQAAMGRTFLEGSHGAVRPEDAHTILLSDAIWRTAYGADEHILGRTVKVSGEAFIVIGVMPRNFVFPFGLEHPIVWVPMIPRNADMLRTKHETPHYEVVARLTAATHLHVASREMQEIQQSVVAQYTDLDGREHVSSIHVDRYEDALVKDSVRKSLLALGSAAIVLWLIACVNVTSLLLARASARQREIAVRGALGASRGRIVQQLLVEGLIVSCAAAMIGIALSMLMLRIFEHRLQTQFRIFTTLTPNLRVLAALLLLTVVSALASSVWPAIALARAPIEASLRQRNGRSGFGRNQQRLRTGLVVTEIAFSLTLLVACGLLLRSIYTLKHIPLGFRADHILVAGMTIPNYKYVGRDLYRDLYAPLLERTQHLPGVESASLMTEVPLGNSFRLVFTFGDDGKDAADIRHSKIRVQARAVTPEVQKVFAFRMLAGRFFNEGDTATSLPVVVVNREFVREYQGEDSDPVKFVGTPLMNFRKDRQAVVVGVLSDERQDSITEPSMPELEVCMPQITPDSMFYKPTGMAMNICGAHQPISG